MTGVCATCAEARGGKSKRGGPLWFLGACGLCAEERAVCSMGDVSWPDAATRKAVLAALMAVSAKGGEGR